MLASSVVRVAGHRRRRWPWRLAVRRRGLVRGHPRTRRPGGGGGLFVASRSFQPFVHLFGPDAIAPVGSPGFQLAFADGTVNGAEMHPRVFGHFFDRPKGGAFFGGHGHASEGDITRRSRVLTRAKGRARMRNDAPGRPLNAESFAAGVPLDAISITRPPVRLAPRPSLTPRRARKLMFAKARRRRAANFRLRRAASRSECREPRRHRGRPRLRRVPGSTIRRRRWRCAMRRCCDRAASGQRRPTSPLA